MVFVSSFSTPATGFVSSTPSVVPETTSRSTYSSSSEAAITDMLTSALDAYGRQLVQIQGWTNGGKPMFSSALKLMFDDIINDGLSGFRLEDMFQLALLEIMINHEKYGLTAWYNSRQTEISKLLESIGSASHSVHEGQGATQLANTASQLYSELINMKASFPADSFLVDILDAMENAGGATALKSQIENNFNNHEGYWNPQTSSSAAATQISPMLRLSLLAVMLQENPAMDQAAVDLILTGTVSEIDTYSMAEFGETAINLLNGYQLGVGTDGVWVGLPIGWRWGSTAPGDTTTPVSIGERSDFYGEGINLTVMGALWDNYPPRNLTDAELKEINRIGDQVKMIDQTLKYWTQILRDEKLAIARNI